MFTYIHLPRSNFFTFPRLSPRVLTTNVSLLNIFAYVCHTCPCSNLFCSYLLDLFILIIHLDILNLSIFLFSSFISTFSAYRSLYSHHSSRHSQLLDLLYSHHSSRHSKLLDLFILIIHLDILNFSISLFSSFISTF